MAKRFVCAVYDSAVEAFGQPFFVAHVGAAVRSFTDEVNRAAPDNALHAHPDDYELFCLAEYDDWDGTFLAGKDIHRMLCRGKDVRILSN